MKKSKDLEGVCEFERIIHENELRSEPVSSWGPVLLEALTAVDGFPFGRLEGDLSLAATVGALYLVHLPWR